MSLKRLSKLQRPLQRRWQNTRSSTYPDPSLASPRNDREEQQEEQGRLGEHSKNSSQKTIPMKVSKSPAAMPMPTAKDGHSFRCLQEGSTEGHMIFLSWPSEGAVLVKPVQVCGV